MEGNNELCRLRTKLVEDLPGLHWYVQACQKCNREYGSEFAVPHWSTGRKSDPIPIAVPGCCSHSEPTFIAALTTTASVPSRFWLNHGSGRQAAV